ncbi:hypothetical protein JOF41_007321 [Saccharothrix coeruleofusca]|nr:hypothetical protein [Saccharothrix coeruleofusca]MBP2341067.1 hypothetical protein [Saccharothrix coeruleofusca]
MTDSTERRVAVPHSAATRAVTALVSSSFPGGDTPHPQTSAAAAA